MNAPFEAGAARVMPTDCMAACGSFISLFGSPYLEIGFVITHFLMSVFVIDCLRHRLPWPLYRLLNGEPEVVVYEIGSEGEDTSYLLVNAVTSLLALSFPYLVLLMFKLIAWFMFLM